MTDPSVTTPFRSVPDVLDKLLLSCALPSEALWRYCEYLEYERIGVTEPALELGCGNGLFTALAIGSVHAAIDINENAVARARSSGTYGSVRCLDARDLVNSEPAFETVVANCVLEHIPGIDEVLVGARAALVDGGRLVATVPLVAMNSHLLIHNSRYVRWRQQTLVHENLFTADEWQKRLMAAGFRSFEWWPYLSARTCHLWDSIDGPGCVGIGRLRAGLVARRLFDHLPGSARARLIHRLRNRLLVRLAEERTEGEPCAAVIVATAG